MSNLASEIPVPLSTLSSWSIGALQEYIQQDLVSAADVRDIWHSLVSSLSIPTLSEKHITSTCNCLRIFLKTTQSAKNSEVKQLPLVRDQWMGCYVAVCSAWPRAKAKPLVQVLEVLLLVARIGMPAEEFDSIWTSVSFELSSVILVGWPVRDLRRALALTSFFLEKKLSFQIYLESTQRPPHTHTIREPACPRPSSSSSGSDALQPLEALFRAVLLSFEQHDAQSSAEKCFRTLLKASVEHGDAHSGWMLVRSFVANHADSLDAVAKSVFPVLLELQPLGYLDLMHRPSNNKDDFLFILVLLQSLREREMICQKDLIGYLHSMVFGEALNTPDAVTFLLSHADDGVRVRALRLLTTSKMTNAPISLQILQSLKARIPLWFRPGSSHERGELLSTIRRFLIRLRGGASTLEKTAQTSSLDRELLEAHFSFVQTLIANVSDEFQPNVSYQRRIVGLSIFKYLLDSRIDRCDRRTARKHVVDPSTEAPGTAEAARKGRARGAAGARADPVEDLRAERAASNDPDWPFSVCLRQIGNAQNLLKLASDAYEDVRALSAGILKHLLITDANTNHSRAFSEQLRTTIALLIPRLEAEAAQTNRSDQADGLGRIYALREIGQEQSDDSNHLANGHGGSVILNLASKLEQALKDKSTLDRLDSQPLHSLLLGVMYCITETRAQHLQGRIIVICRQVWNTVAHRLCIDSPETTEEDGDDFEETVTGPKDLLSFSWRALRDSSLLLRALLNIPQGPVTEQALQNLSMIGQLCMEQLIRLRHRGAFSTVAQTFTVCCQRTIELEGPALFGLRYKWYQEAENQIVQQADRLTRRSAGLPALIASILSPDDDESFRGFIDSFIARSHMTGNDQNRQAVPISLPQVHALNALREVMINSRFRNAVVPHTQKLLALATKTLGSHIWAIQNCGLMLYRACLLRLPNEVDNQPPGPGLLNKDNGSASVMLAFELLHGPATETNRHDPEGSSDYALTGVEQKFAALDLIAYIPPMEDSKHDIRAAVVELLNNPIWPIRERAAEVLALRTPIDEFRKQFRYCLEVIEMGSNQKKLHGKMLYFRRLLQRGLSGTSKQEVKAELHQAVEDLLQLATAQDVKYHLAPPVWATILEIINDVTEQSLGMDSSNTPLLPKYEEILSDAKIRGYYLSEKALLYNVALNLIRLDNLEIQENKIFPVFLDRMVSNPDVAKDVVGRLLGQALVFQPRELLRLCQELPSRTHPHVVPLVLDTISLSVEASYSRWDATKALHFLTYLDYPSQTREIDASKLVARARLLSLLTVRQENSSDLDATITRQEKQLEKDVQDAARDDMDTYTRLQAAKALSAYLPLLPRTGLNNFTLLITLRDLLNDDDEDVRSLAAHTASAFLSKETINLQHTVLTEGICAPAIAVQLEDFLHAIASEHIIEPEMLLRRLLNVDPHTELHDYFFNRTVSKQLSLIKEDARALFAVERQNLYVDEIHEIHFWSSICRVYTGELNVPIARNIELALGEWLADGLGTLISLLDDLDESTTLPNITFNIDVLLLCVRVVSTAGTYLSTRKPDAEVDLTCQSIRDRLQELKLMASQCQFNSKLTYSINDCLEAIMRRNSV